MWARTSMADQLSFALDTAVATLDHYNGFFGVPFPLPKCDLVAVPDFAAGAMENWGLVTYRETALLGNVSISSVAELERVAVVVCHELAHQYVAGCWMCVSYVVCCGPLWHRISAGPRKS